jgi:hypothetical protein
VFATALEAELLASACLQNDLRYEAIICVLAQLRTTLAALHSQHTALESLRTAHDAAVARLTDLCDRYVRAVDDARAANQGSLLDAVAGAPIVSYPVECARALEMCALSFFLGTEEQRSRAERCLLGLLQEDGAAHPVSDRFAVTYVAAGLALVATGHQDELRALLNRVVIWVADRYEQGMGLAEFDAPPLREVQFLLGFPFRGVGVEPRTSSLLATVLCDLAAFLGDQAFFANVVNEFKAVELAFEYFQPLDTEGQFEIEGEDVRQYPNVEYTDAPGVFADFAFGTHVRDEPRSFALADRVGLPPYAGLMLLLRDRYFPGLWQRFVALGRL